jgi:hypothetical protein
MHVARTTKWGTKRHLIHDRRGAEWIILNLSVYELPRMTFMQAQ